MNKRAMAIVALALCACMLAPCAQAQADPTLVEAGRFSAYAEFAETAALVIDEDAQTGLEGVFDIQGEALVPAAFGAIEQADEEANFFIVQNESGVNAIGLIDRTGRQVMPMAYGDIEILSDCWAVGIKLEVAQGEEYDYMSLFGQDNYNVATCDFYDLSAGELRGTLTREEYNYAVVVGEYLLVEDRAGALNSYDAQMTPVFTDIQEGSLYSPYARAEGGVINVASGQTLFEGYINGYELGGGLFQVTDENYDYLLVDAQGNALTAAGAYDAFYEFDADGYAKVEKDDLYGLIDAQGNLVIPCEYDGIESAYIGGQSFYSLGGYACVEKDAKYGYVSLETGEVTCPINYAQPMILGASMIVPDISGSLYIIAADGVMTPTEYVEFYEYAGGDGTLLVATDAEGNSGLVDWHGAVLLDFVYDSAYDIDISADGAAVMVDTDEGSLVYAVERG